MAVSQETLATALTRKLRKAWDETNQLVFNALDNVHLYLERCGDVAQGYCKFFDYNLLHGRIWPTTLSNLTSELLVTAEDAINIWIALWVRFNRGDISQCFRRCSVSSGLNLSLPILYSCVLIAL